MGFGWICLHRSMEDHWLWGDKPFSKGQAWIDLLLMANYKPVKKLYKGNLMTFETGSVYHSQRDLADRWGWSRDKVGRFLKSLESDGMCTTKRTTYGTCIIIENYSKYQDEFATDKATNKATDKATDKAQVNKYNKYNKYNNISCGDSTENLNNSSFSPEEQKLMTEYEKRWGINSVAFDMIPTWIRLYGDRQVMNAIDKVGKLKNIDSPHRYIDKMLKNWARNDDDDIDDEEYGGTWVG